jgi:hypothetical protein
MKGDAVRQHPCLELQSVRPLSHQELTFLYAFPPYLHTCLHLGHLVTLSNGSRVAIKHCHWQCLPSRIHSPCMLVLGSGLALDDLAHAV